MLNKIIYCQKHIRQKHASKIQINHILLELHLCRYIVKIKIFHLDFNDYFIYVYYLSTYNKKTQIPCHGNKG